MQQTIRTLSSLTLGALALATAAGCGAGPLAAGAARSGLMAAKEIGWEAPVILEDFQDMKATDKPDRNRSNLTDSGNEYDLYVPDDHPFFGAITFTVVKPKAAGSICLEMLGPSRSKPNRGLAITDDCAEQGAFFRGEGDKRKFAEKAKVAFKWGLNAQASADNQTYARMVYVFGYMPAGAKEPVERALAYSWGSTACVGDVIKSDLALSRDRHIEMATIVLAQGPGPVSEACGEAAMDKIPLLKVERNFLRDARWAFSQPGTPSVCVPGSTPGGGTVTPVAAVFPPANFPDDPNRGEFWGITQIGFGSEMARNTCAHSLIDDVTVQLKWPSAANPI